MRPEPVNFDEIYVIENDVKYTLRYIELMFEKQFGGRTDVIGRRADTDVDTDADTDADTNADDRRWIRIRFEASETEKLCTSL